MITALIVEPGHLSTEAQSEATLRVRRALAGRVRVLDTCLEELSQASLSTLPVDLVVFEAQHVTDEVLLRLAQVRGACPECVTTCVATEEAAERAQAEGALTPDYWLILPATDLQLTAQMDAILATCKARPSRAMTAMGGGLAPGSGGGGLMSPNGSLQRSESALYRTVGRLTGSFDTEQLLSAYCDAVHEMTQCVSYCLLWQDLRGREFRVARAEGLSPVVQEICRFAPTDPLPAWMQRNRAIAVRDVLGDGLDASAVVREMDLCGGVLAVPLFCQGVLRGVMVVGPKVIGAPYYASDAETLFVLSANAAAAVRQAELHGELEARNNYIDQVLSTMESGIVTINPEGRVLVCNPYAADVLRLKRDAVISRDLRALPSPLGDFLYSCLTYGEERTREEVVVLGGQATLRVSARRLLGADGSLIGSMLLLEDVTAEKALAEERRRAERSDVIGQVVARFAHEIKNPLATIHTFAELLPTRVDDPEFQAFWSEHVRTDVNRLNDLVGKMVSLAEQPLSRREMVGVGDLVQMAVRRVESLDPAAEGKITTGVHGDIPSVQVDASVMSAALSHLLRFALGERHGPVRVEAHLQEGPKGEQPVSIQIRSRRPAMTGADPGSLLDPTYVMEHPDIDLGPSASQRLVESQGGALEAFHDGDEMVFRVSLIPVHGPVVGQPAANEQ
jgi:nitrogen-specific signal transduction histidine kinase